MQSMNELDYFFVNYLIGQRSGNPHSHVAHDFFKMEENLDRMEKGTRIDPSSPPFDPAIPAAPRLSHCRS